MSVVGEMRTTSTAVLGYLLYKEPLHTLITASAARMMDRPRRTNRWIWKK